MTELVVLMRAVNVGGRTLPMAELRALCDELGFGNPETYIQSGNLLIDTAKSLEATEKTLSRAIADRFALDVPLILRTASKWQGYIDGNPFAGEAVEEKFLHLLLASKKPPKGAIAELEDRAQGGERVRIAGDALWIDYADGVGRSKLTPKAIDKAVGAPATGRNLKTVLKLQQMIEERTR